jgi:uncharacterized lipoprotein YmbA
MRISSFLLYLTFLVVLFCGAGCIGIGGDVEVQPTRYYTLELVDLPPKVASSEQTIEIGIGQIVLPDYLNRKEIALKTGENELRYTQRNLWAERPTVALQRILTGNIERQTTKTLEVYSLPWPDHSNPEIVVQLNFQSFEGRESPDVEVLLVASWTIQSASDGTVYKQGFYSEDAVKWRKGNYSSLATGLSQGLGKLGLKIAGDIDEVVDSLYQ